MYLRQIWIEQYIVSEQLVAIVSVYVWPSEVQFSLRLNTQQTLDDNIVDFGPHERAVDAKLLHMCAEGSHAPLKATVALLSILILDESFILFVDWIVGQVRELGFLAC